MLIDLHVHSTISPCSCLPLEDILRQARAQGLDGVCITDHDTMAARHAVRDGARADGLVVIVGMEYATTQGDFLLFGPFENLEPGLPAPRVLKLVHEAGGAAVVAHPRRKTRPADPELTAELGRTGLLHCVETCNGRNSHTENNRAQAWPSRYGLTAVGGSDAHALDELGRSPTRFFTPIATRQDLIQALKEGHCAPAKNAATLQRFAHGQILPAYASPHL